MPEKTVIKLEKIKKVYDMGESRILALQGVNLTVSSGEMVAVMGSSGSGKSTLLNIIGCLDKPTEGSYLLDGESISKLDKDKLAAIRNKRIGFVFQGFNLLGRVKVLDNVQLPLVYCGTEKKLMTASAKEALNWVGLAKYYNHYPTQMSGGQQQRVAIARALVNNPSLVLADEPTGALDSKTSLEIIAVLQRLNKEKGITLIIVTHEREIASYCQRLVLMKDGQVIEDSIVSNHRNAARDLEAFPQETEEKE